MQRRVFILEAGKAVPAVVGALYLIGCGDSTVAPSNVADIKSDSTVVNGHFHTVNVSSSDQTKGVATTYTSSASLSHDHMVTLSASQLTTLAQLGTVTVTSTNSTVTGNHSHDFTFVGKKI
jgi:hypothetical protein